MECRAPQARGAVVAHSGSGGTGHRGPEMFYRGPSWLLATLNAAAHFKTVALKHVEELVFSLLSPPPPQSHPL